jgi:hypothetical protein
MQEVQDPLIYCIFHHRILEYASLTADPNAAIDALCYLHNFHGSGIWARRQGHDLCTTIFVLPRDEITMRSFTLDLDFSGATRNVSFK